MPRAKTDNVARPIYPVGLGIGDEIQALEIRLPIVLSEGPVADLAPPSVPL